MKENLTEKLIDDLFEVSQSQLPESVRHQAKRCLLDYLGVSLAGAKMIQPKPAALLDLFGAVPGDARVLGLGRKASLPTAALLNGMSAHIAELDDGDRFGMVHPGAPVISALLPLAELKQVSADQFLKAMVAGYEAAIRVARALQPALKDRGLHATGVCGTLGAAIGVSTLLGATKFQMKDSFCAAATSSAGLLRVIKGGSELKPFNAGQAAMSGLVAAFSAQAGFRGPDDVLGGAHGFLSIMGGKNEITLPEKNLGEGFGIERIYMKPYAACRHCHPAIAAAINIRAKNEFVADDIAAVKIFTYRWAVDGHEHSIVDGVTSAKMSTPFSVAVALETGMAGINEFLPERLSDPRILALAKRVEVSPDDALTAEVPQKRAAIVEITTKNGQYFKEKVDLPKGEPECPLSESELKEKFMSLARFGQKSDAEALKIVDSVFDLEDRLGAIYEQL